MVRGAWPMRTTLNSLGFPEPAQGRVEVKSKSTTPPTPSSLARAVCSLASEQPRITLQGCRARRGRVPAGAGLGGGDEKAEECVGKCSCANLSSMAYTGSAFGIGTTTTRSLRAGPESPCALGTTLYPISGGEGDVTCELVTYERLWRKLFNRILLYPERRTAFPACRGCSGKGDAPSRPSHSFIKWHRAVVWGWARFFRPGSGFAARPPVASPELPGR